MFERLDDTIVAVSSPPGSSARGILRLSGPEAIPMAQQVFLPEPGSSLQSPGGYRRLRGRVRIEAEATVRAEAYLFLPPASYTRQAVVELHTVGSPPVLAMVIDRLVSAGARPAEPGEFTARAYASGALDLTEVEAIAGLIHARTDAQLRAAQALLQGRLGRRSAELREELADLLALLEAEIDFVEEGIEFVSARQVGSILERVLHELDALLGSGPELERLEALPRVMLVGRPNGGKSTLFNRLAGRARAIESPTPGTTRDVLSVVLEVDGGPVMLLDSAGTDPLSPPETPDAGDAAAMADAATRRGLATADLLVLVVDAARESPDCISALRAALPDRALIVVANKIDALPGGLQPAWASPEVIPASGRTGEGVDALRARIAVMVFSGVPAHGEELLALSIRQRASLGEARSAIVRASELCRNASNLRGFSELLALEVREATGALSLLTGALATEELLGRIFARFCIGK